MMQSLNSKVSEHFFLLGGPHHMQFTVEQCHGAAVGRLDHLHEYLIGLL